MKQKRDDRKSKISSVMKVLVVIAAAAFLMIIFIPVIFAKPEDTPSFEAQLDNIHSEANDLHGLLDQLSVEDEKIEIIAIHEIEILENEILESDSIEDDIKDEDNIEDEEVNETEAAEEELPLIVVHETNVVVPDGFDRYAVTYHLFKTNVPGPNIALIGGVHGSERAGYEAAQQIVDNFDFTGGNFLIIPKATATIPDEWGPGGLNLNRQFPGNPEGNAAQRVAAVITQLLDDFSPCVIIDFHEAYRDGFSNKILYWPDHEITQEKLEAIGVASDAINQTDLVGRHLGSYGGRDFGPARSKLVPGTTTREYTLRYNIPVFTTETCMSNRLEVRVNQIIFITNALFEFFMDRYEPNSGVQAEEGLYYGIFTATS